MKYILIKNNIAENIIHCEDSSILNEISKHYDLVLPREQYPNAEINSPWNGSSFEKSPMTIQMEELLKKQEEEYENLIKSLQEKNIEDLNDNEKNILKKYELMQKNPENLTEEELQFLYQ